MNKNNKRQRLIISEYENKISQRRTTQARSQLYDLVAWFRKNAETSSDIGTRKIFAFAAEIISGLVRAFRQHEDELNEQDEIETHGDGRNGF